MFFLILFRDLNTLLENVRSFKYRHFFLIVKGEKISDVFDR